MAELNLGKGLTAGKVASNVQKKLTRAQEKVRAARWRAGVWWWWCGGRWLFRPNAAASTVHPSVHPSNPARRSVASRHHHNTDGGWWVLGMPPSKTSSPSPGANVTQRARSCCSEIYCTGLVIPSVSAERGTDALQALWISNLVSQPECVTETVTTGRPILLHFTASVMIMITHAAVSIGGRCEACSMR